MSLKKLLQTALENNGYALSGTLQDQLIAYLELLAQWNQVFNLTGIREITAGVHLHILDSLAIGRYLQGDLLLDVGSGAGLPGIPLALAYPTKQFVLLDSNNKKTRFLTQVGYELGIKNISVVHARCERFMPAQGFNSIITRAFGSLAMMLKSTAHLLAAEGQFLAMKGLLPSAELAEVKMPFKVLAVHPLTIKGLDAARHLVCIEKQKETDSG